MYVSLFLVIDNKQVAVATYYLKVRPLRMKPRQELESLKNIQ